METNPIEIFKKWFYEELSLSKASIPAACCLSTIGTDDYPNARFVSLKGVVESKFIITGSLTSRKGIEINNSNKVALSFWWTGTEKQVRIQGNATIIGKELARKYFEERSRDSQIVSIISNQGQIINDIEILHKKYKEFETNFRNRPLPMPENWGGFSIEPIRIEFLDFKPTRFHARQLYAIDSGKWTKTFLQP